MFWINSSIVSLALLPIAYLRFAQLPAGTFGRNPRKQGYFNVIDLKYETHYYLHKTINSADFQLIICSIFGRLTL